MAKSPSHHPQGRKPVAWESKMHLDVITLDDVKADTKQSDKNIANQLLYIWQRDHHTSLGDPHGNRPQGRKPVARKPKMHLDAITLDVVKADTNQRDNNVAKRPSHFA